MKKLQDLENSISYRRATFGKFKFKFKILAGKIWKILDLAARFGKFKILLARFGKFQILPARFGMFKFLPARFGKFKILQLIRIRVNSPLLTYHLGNKS